MANDLLNELNRNLANAEEIGNEEWASALKARIAELEKPTKSAAKAEPDGIVVTDTNSNTITGNTITGNTFSKPAAKKATKTAKKASKK